MNHDHYDDAYIRKVLDDAKTIAVVGASPNAERPSNGVMRYMIAQGYQIVPVNPGHAGCEIAGQLTYASLAAIPFAIDMVDIFRNSNDAAGVVDEALAMKHLPKVIWMQLDVRHDGAAAKAEAAGIAVVMDRCPKIEFARLQLLQV